MKTETPVELAVCTDCLFVLANGVKNEDTERAAKDLAEKWGDTQLTLGKLTDECGHDWQNSSDQEAHAECEQLGFSWRTCEGCGSDLGGDRHAATAWVKTDE